MTTRFLKISANSNKFFENLVKWQDLPKLTTAPSYFIIFNFSFLFSTVIGAADRVTMSIKFDLEVVLKELVEQEQFPKIKVCKKEGLLNKYLISPFGPIQ